MSKCVFHDTEPSLQDRKLFEIVEAAYAQRQKVVIFAQTVERAASIDRTLWIQKQEAFVPHQICVYGQPEPEVPIAIVTAEYNPIGAGILIADGHCSLDYSTAFEVIHEFVNRSSPGLHEACRERFRAYRARRVSIEHLKPR